MSNKKKFKNQKNFLSELVFEMIKSSKFNQDIKDHLINKHYQKSWFNEGIVLCLEEENSKKYEQLYRKFELSEEGTVLSGKEFEEIIAGTVFDYLSKNMKRKYTKIDSQRISREILTKIERSLFRGRVAIPLFGIDLRVSKLKVGNCNIVKVTDNWCKRNTFCAKDVKIVFELSEEPDAVYVFDTKKDISTMKVKLGSVCAEFPLKTSTKKILETSLKFLGQIIGFLWLYVPLNPYCSEDSLAFGPHFGRQNDLALSPFFINDKDSKEIKRIILDCRRSVPNTLTIDDNVIHKYKKNGNYNKFSKLLFEKETNTEMIERLKTSLFWYGRAMSQIDTTQKFLFLAIALEALLSPQKKEGIISSISESAAFLLYSNVDERIGLIKTLKEIYDQRSSVVHGRTNTVAPTDIKNLQTIVKLSIVRILTSKFTQSSYKEFSDKLKVFKFSYRIKRGEL